MELNGNGITPSNRWSRNTALANCPPLELWPTVVASTFEEDSARKFNSFKDAVSLYFAGLPGREIEARTGVTRTYIAKLAKKCLTLASDGQIFGFRALIPYVRISPNIRHASFSEKRRHQQGGLSGVLNVMLQRFPQLEEELTNHILNYSKANKLLEHRIAAKTLHKIFMDTVRANGVCETEWPFNTQYHGLRTIQKFMSRLLHENFSRAVNVRSESAAKAHLSTGTGKSTFLSFDEPYDAVEIDAYRVDSFLSVAFQTPEGTETELLLERLWLVAAVDRASTAVLAYSIVYRSEVTSDDVVRTIAKAISKRWEPKKLITGTKYPPDSGLANGVIPELLYACWTTTFLDGALAHLSEAIHSKVRKRLGIVISWGAVGHFERRPNIERTFGEISKDVFKRLPSTTGANPFNGRAPDAEKKAVRHKVRAVLAEDAVDVYFAQHNVTPASGVSYLTPIEFIRYFLNERSDQFMLRRLPKSIIEKNNIFSEFIIVTVRGSIKTGRRPYIQLDGGHYTNSILNELTNLIGKKILVEVVDEEDFRHLKAYLMNGAELGFLSVSGRWAKTKHSRRTRKAINNLIAKKILVLSEFDDPILKTLEYLSTPKQQKKKNDLPLAPRQATEATRLAMEVDATPTIATKPKKFNAPITHSTKELQNRRSILDQPIPTVKKVRNAK